MMANKATTKVTPASGGTAPATLPTNPPTVEDAFNTLKTYDWGADRAALDPIDREILATQSDAAARRALEKRLVDALAGGLSRSAQDYVCRKLRVVGTAQSVPALAALLPDEATSHLARYALERIPDEKALTVLREALPQVGDKLKPGLIGSLGKRRDRRSVKAIAQLLGDSDAQVAHSAAQALGLIGTPTAAQELSRLAKKAPAHMRIAAADACLVCAEQLLADGKKPEAAALYKQLQGNDQPAHVKAAAIKGLLTAATKK